MMGGGVGWRGKKKNRREGDAKKEKESLIGCGGDRTSDRHLFGGIAREGVYSRLATEKMRKKILRGVLTETAKKPSFGNWRKGAS